MALHSPKSTADKLADENVDSTDSELRYAAYGARLRTALRASHRYLAYVRLIRSTRTRDNNHLPPLRPVTLENPFGPSCPPPW
jgi:Mitochondrial 18 KDa protein (MTP18)